MNECEKVSELLIDYLNQRLTQDENFAVIKHIAECQYCRSEIAALIKVRNLAQENMSPIPQDILDSAFDKVPEKEIPEKEGILNSVLNLGQYFKALEPLSDTMSIVKQTLKLAMQAI